MKFTYYAQTNNEQEDYQGEIEAKGEQEARRIVMRDLRAALGSETFINLEIKRV